MAINTLQYATLFQKNLDLLAVQEATTGWMDANAGQVLSLIHISCYTGEQTPTRRAKPETSLQPRKGYIRYGERLFYGKPDIV